MEKDGTHTTIVDGCEMCFYHLHDGKMLYLLTQHSLFNRKNRPFLLCSGERGECLNNNHECKVITHDNQVNLWKKSKRRWERKRNKLKEGEVYKKKNIWTGLI